VEEIFVISLKQQYQLSPEYFIYEVQEGRHSITCCVESGQPQTVNLFSSSTNDQLCVDVNECSPDKQNPCQNGGTCMNTIGGFKCKCPPQYMGDLCDEGIFFLACIQC